MDKGAFSQDAAFVSCLSYIIVVLESRQKNKANHLEKSVLRGLSGMHVKFVYGGF